MAAVKKFKAILDRKQSLAPENLDIAIVFNPSCGLFLLYFKDQQDLSKSVMIDYLTLTLVTVYNFFQNFS